MNEFVLHQKTCFVCEKGARSGHLVQAKNNQVLLTLFKDAKTSEKSDLAKTIKALVAAEEKVFYHDKCYASLHSFYQPTDSVTPNSLLKEAFQKVINVINEKVSRDRDFEFISKLRDIYETEARRLHETVEFDFNKRSLFKLEQKISHHFQDAVEIREPKERIKIVVPPGCNVALVVKNQILDDDVLQKAAQRIRDIALHQVQKEPLPTNRPSMTRDVLRGECPKIPETLVKFFNCILSGKSLRRSGSQTVKRLSNLLSQDIIYHVNNGQIRTSKHLNTALMLKNLTSNKKIVTIGQRLGVCVSYYVAESVESALATSISRSKRVCPPEIGLNKDRPVIVA